MMRSHRDARTPLPLHGAKSAVMRLGTGNPAPSPVVVSGSDAAAPTHTHQQSRHRQRTGGGGPEAQSASRDLRVGDASALRARAASTPCADASMTTAAPELVSITPLLQPRHPHPHQRARSGSAREVAQPHGSPSPDTPPPLSGAVALASVKGGAGGGATTRPLASLPVPRSAAAAAAAPPQSAACWGLAEPDSGGVHDADGRTSAPQPPSHASKRASKHQGKRHQRASTGRSSALGTVHASASWASAPTTLAATPRQQGKKGGSVSSGVRRHRNGKGSGKGSGSARCGARGERRKRRSGSSASSASSVPRRPLPPPNALTCKAWAIADDTTGELLAHSRADLRLQMASITKVMTAVVVLHAVEEEGPELLDEYVLVSRDSAAIRGTSAKLRVGEVHTVRDLLFGMMLPSGNDAASALAEYLGDSFDPPHNPGSLAPLHPEGHGHPWSRFVAEMNRQAKGLGLRSTFFANPHGLQHSRLKSTARDVAMLVAYALRRWPLFRAIVSTKQHQCHARALPARLVASNSRKYPYAVTWNNTNALLNTQVHGRRFHAASSSGGGPHTSRRPGSSSSSSSLGNHGTAGHTAAPSGTAAGAAGNGDAGDAAAGNRGRDVGGGGTVAGCRCTGDDGDVGTFVFHGVKTGITRAAGGCLASWLRPASAGPSEGQLRQADDGSAGTAVPFTWQHAPRSCAAPAGDLCEHHDSCALMSGRRSGGSTSSRRTPRSAGHAAACTCSAATRARAEAGIVIVVLGSHNAKARFADTFKLAQWAVGGGRLLTCTCGCGCEV